MGLGDIGYTEPTPIQELSIPVILEKKDVLGAAQTGTGKTGAFVIPIIQQILENPSEGTKALILSPTRELAQQIDEQIFALGYHCGISSATIIGGEDFSRQANAIRAGVDIIVATPGRLIDQTKVLDVDFEHIKYLILDEADRMLDMGFMPDVTHIIDKLPKKRQTLLFSATMPKQIQKLAQDIMINPELIEIELSKPAESVEQRAYLIDGREKLKLAQALLDDMEWSSCIIFTATKRGTDQLERLLSKKGIKVASIHGDRDQNERTKALNDFKNGKVPIIVATDVLARGIDIADVSLIINYDVPRAVEDYIHRIGRTGRYDKTGVAITLVSKQDTKFFNAIKEKAGKDLQIFKGSDSLKGASKKAENNPAENKPKPDQKKSSKPEPKREIVPDFSKAKTVAFTQDKEGNISIEFVGKTVEKRAEAPKKQEKKVSSKNTKKQPKQAKETKKSPRQNKKEARTPRKPKVEIKTIEKASERNKNSRKPAKGLWGLIKSFFPK
ncbi:MAG: DEAD/DEAH box helicase [Balneolaceae bacterium]|nr:DEAD/DEAH box helicase [Balneolaceae bacterium]MBO6546147.1 DEAD/DEAH box helicase [Balneolaceae bacterium]MBO6648505.1 DEAD/DEAH box helicase [Balneolaceae bacterium]